MSLNFPRVAFGGVILTLVLGSGPVFAADAKAIADAFVAVTTASGDNQTTYGGATASGDDVTITDLKSVNKDGGTVTIPSIVITGAQPRDKGGFTASKFTFDNTSIVSADSTFTWKTGSATDVTIPSPEEAKAKAKIRPFATLAVTDLNVTSADMPAPVAIGGLNIGVDMDDAGVPRDFSVKVDAIKLPPELFANEPQQKAVLDALGYSGFTINVDVAGGYETANDTLTMRNFTIDALDVGKLNIDGKFSSVPLSKLASGDPSDDMANGKLDNLTIRFDNSGIVERALDMQAKMMGGSRDEVVAQLGGALPFMLNAIGNQGLQDKIAAAGQAFLKDPKSITILLSPPAPVGFSQIMSVAGEQPQTLPDLLAVDVQANN